MPTSNNNSKGLQIHADKTYNLSASPFPNR